MKLLLLEIWVYLLVAFLFGMFVQWFFCCRNKKGSETASAAPIVGSSSSSQTTAAVKPTAAEPATTKAPLQIDDSWRPAGLSAAPADADELKRIKGIGAVIEGTLNELGVYKFEQIADWTTDNIAWIENSIAFPGRISREGWISQAKTLAEGGTTEFAKRVDTGEVGYK